MFSDGEIPDALFVANDHMAIAVMDVLRAELGLGIPEDVSIVSYDDVPAAGWQAYDLTTIQQPADLMVNATVDILLAQIEGYEGIENRIQINAPLVIRGSARVPEDWDNERL